MRVVLLMWLLVLAPLGAAELEVKCDLQDRDGRFYPLGTHRLSTTQPASFDIPSPARTHAHVQAVPAGSSWTVTFSVEPPPGGHIEYLTTPTLLVGQEAPSGLLMRINGRYLRFETRIYESAAETAPARSDYGLHTCSRCNGKGGRYCRTCSGDGACKHCRRTHLCQSCGGSGTRLSGSQCYMCSGTGQCYYCSGRGVCLMCRGRGLYVCRDCKGRGIKSGNPPLSARPAPTSAPPSPFRLMQ